MERTRKKAGWVDVEFTGSVEYLVITISVFYLILLSFGSHVCTTVIYSSSRNHHQTKTNILYTDIKKRSQITSQQRNKLEEMLTWWQETNENNDGTKIMRIFWLASTWKKENHRNKYIVTFSYCFRDHLLFIERLDKRNKTFNWLNKMVCMANSSTGHGDTRGRENSRDFSEPLVSNAALFCVLFFPSYVRLSFVIFFTFKTCENLAGTSSCGSRCGTYI